MIELISTYWTNYLVVHFIFAGTGLAISSLGFLGFHYRSLIDLEFICEVTDVE